MNDTIHILLVDADSKRADAFAKLLSEETNPRFAVERVAPADAHARVCGKAEVILYALDSKGAEAFAAFHSKLTRECAAVVLADEDQEAAAVECVRRGAKEYLLRGQLNPKLVSSVLRYAINLQHTEETLRRSQERFRILIENSSDILTILKSDGTVLYESPALERLFGYRAHELEGKKIFEFVHPDDLEYVEENFKKSIKYRILNQRVEFRFRHRDGSWRIIEAIGSTTLDEKHGLIAVVNSRDVTERVQLEEQLLSLSLDDQLTGLLNRRGFMSFGVQQLKLAKRTKQQICLLFADVDRMKEINDTYGHREGDKTLSELGRILRETFREPDIIGRLGGDEFAVLAIGAAEANAVTLVTRLLARIQARNAQKEHRGRPVALSLGVVHFDPAHPCPIEELLARADTLMYEQKRLKR